MRDNAHYKSLQEIELPEYNEQEILKDELITITYKVNNEKRPLILRRIAFWHEQYSKLLVLNDQ